MHCTPSADRSLVGLGALLDLLAGLLVYADVNDGAFSVSHRDTIDHNGMVAVNYSDGFSYSKSLARSGASSSSAARRSCGVIPISFTWMALICL